LEITGNPALTGFTAPKILWVRQHEPEVYARIAHILLPKDYIRYRLTGEFAIDCAEASGTFAGLICTAATGRLKYWINWPFHAPGCLKSSRGQPSPGVSLHPLQQVTGLAAGTIVSAAAATRPPERLALARYPGHCLPGIRHFGGRFCTHRAALH